MITMELPEETLWRESVLEPESRTTRAKAQPQQKSWLDGFPSVSQ